MKVIGVFLVSVLLYTKAFSFGKCTESYVPETNYEELLEIRKWATVLAFIPFSQKAGFHFDAERYMLVNPNPNVSAFNFGSVTGYNCYPVDVISSYASYGTVLAKLYYTDPTEFKKFFIKHSIKLGYMSYLSPLDLETEKLLGSLILVSHEI